ncbi:MAG: translational GTPase TypA [Proteobacteria bacterium]|nr:translational GTPase TypA [Pseudomonadota bacterium]
MYNVENIRDVAIIAHVDHGKTTLVDQLLQQSGVYKEHQQVQERAMDSNEIEKERGITILAKNTAVEFDGILFNIVDTPGHADFGGEVERVLSMVDSVVLLVDAAEGPMPQTKFVLSKALNLGLKPIVVVNKVDRHDARPQEVVDEVFDLFVSLEASDEQLDFPVLFGAARDGWLSKDFKEPTENCHDLFELMKTYIPHPDVKSEGEFSMLATTIEKDNFLGRMITGRIYSGTVKTNQNVKVMDMDGNLVEKGRISKILAFRGLERKAVDEAIAGDIVTIAGLPEVMVSNTICDESITEVIPSQPIDPPTLAMTFGVNTSPLAGLEGKKLTSREIKDRLEAEAEVNVALQVEQGSTTETFKVMGRGELMLSVLIENMRREGFELSIARPEVLFREIDGVQQEPYEEVVVDVDEEFASVVMEKMGNKKAEMKNMSSARGKQRLTFIAPSRAMIGYQSEFMMDTRGTGLLNRVFSHYGELKTQKKSRQEGVLVSMISGTSVPYALFYLEARGNLFITNGVKVYDGMIIGETAKPGDLEVNPVKEKQQTNVRSSGKDEAVKLTRIKEKTLEEALTYIAEDELLEVTPESLRLRKKGLTAHERKQHRRLIQDGKAVV